MFKRIDSKLAIAKAQFPKKSSTSAALSILTDISWIRRISGELKRESNNMMNGRVSIFLASMSFSVLIVFFLNKTQLQIDVAKTTVREAMTNIKKKVNTEAKLANLPL